MGLRTSIIGLVLGRARTEARTSEKLLLPRRRRARIWPGPARRPLATGRQSPTARPRAACITMTGSALHLCECATRAVRWTRCQHSSHCRAGRPCGRGARAPSSVLWGLVGGSELTLRTVQSSHPLWPTFPGCGKRRLNTFRRNYTCNQKTANSRSFSFGDSEFSSEESTEKGQQIAEKSHCPLNCPPLCTPTGGPAYPNSGTAAPYDPRIILSDESMIQAGQNDQNMQGLDLHDAR